MFILRRTLGLCNKNISQAYKASRTYTIQVHKNLPVDLQLIAPDEGLRITRIRDHLSTFKLKELTKLANSCGIKSSGIKSALVDIILTHFKPFILTKDNPYPHFEIPKSIISVDVGYRNLSYVQLSAKNEILAWHLINLNLENYENNSFATAVSNFVHEHLLKLVDIGAFVIEQQRYRSSGGHAVLDSTLRVNAIAYILIGILVDRFKFNSANFFHGNVVHNVLPQRVAKFHEISGDKKSSKKKKAEKSNEEDDETVDVGNNDISFSALISAAKSQKVSSKKIRAKHLVSGMLLSDKHVFCPTKLRTMYFESKKKDDLSDCLLQGLAWYDWARFSIEQAKLLNGL